MKTLGLSALWLRWKLAYYEWALSEMDPLHRDLPRVVMIVRELKQQLKEGAGE